MPTAVEYEQLFRILRNVLEHGRGALPEKTTTGGRTPNRIDFVLSDFPAVTDPKGKEFVESGNFVLLASSSHASCALQIAFDRVVPTKDTDWLPLIPGEVARKPDGSDFEAFRVRRQTLTPSNTNAGTFLVDSSQSVASVLTQPRVPNVTPGGKLEAILEGTTLAGVDVLLKASDAGELAAAGWTGAAYVALLASALGRLCVNTIGGQDGVAAGSGANGAAVQRVTVATDDVLALAAKLDLDTLAGIVTAGRAAANLIVGQAGVDGNTGAVSAKTQRVTLATDVALPAGTAVLGKTDPQKTTITAALAQAASYAHLPAVANQRLCGFSARETAGATASFRLCNAASATNPRGVLVNLAANESIRDVLPDVDFALGIYVEILSGTIDLATYTKVVS